MNDDKARQSTHLVLQRRKGKGLRMYFKKLWVMGSRRRRDRTWSSPSPTHASKTHLHVEQSHRTSTGYWPKTSDLQRGEKISTQLGSTHTQERRRQRGLDRTCALGRSCERGKVSTHWEVSSQWGDQLRQAGSLGGECRNRFAEAKAEKASALGSLQPEPLLLGREGVGALARASEGRPGEDWGWLGVVSHSRGSMGGGLGPPERQGTISGGTGGEGWAA